MADTLSFDLVSPERLVASFDADSVRIPGVEGELTALPAHAPFLTTLRPGIVTVQEGAKTHEFFVTGGFAEVSPFATTVLAEEAVERGRLDRAYLEARIAEAEAALEIAPEEARIAAAQRVADFRSVIGQYGL